MYKATLKSLWGRKLRLLMSTLAITLGVAFLTGSFVFSDMLRASFDETVKAGVPDVSVTAQQDAEVAQGRADKPRLTSAVVAEAAKVPGISRVEGSVEAMGVVVIGANGKALTTFGPPQFGVNFYEAPALDGHRSTWLAEGRAPAKDDEITIDHTTMQKSGHHLGSRVKVITPSAGTIEATVVGVVRQGEAGTAGATFVNFTTKRAQQLFLDGQDGFTSLWVVTEPGADRAQVAKDLNEVLPEGYLAEDGAVVAERNESEIAQILSFVDIFLLVFAGISLVVASFLVVNTFGILVAQRSRELALFRSMGASRGQLFGTVIVEAVVLGAVGSVLGLVAGLGIAIAIKKSMLLMDWDLGPTSVTLSPTTVLVSMATGLLVTVLASIGPARRATHVAPIEAMTSARNESESGLGRRGIVGVVLAVLGAAAILVGLGLDDATNRSITAGVGMLLALVGVTVASPLLGRPVVWLVGKLYRAVFGEVGRLATLNSVRQPRRTAATAAALMIGMTLVSAMAVFGHSAKVSVSNQVAATVRGDFMVGRQGFQGFAPQVGDKLADVDGVQQVHRAQVAIGELLVDGAKPTGRPGHAIGAMAPGAIDHIFPMDVVEGRAFAKPGEMIVEQDEAKKAGLHVGSVERVHFPEAQRSMDLTVVGIFSKGKGQAILQRVVSSETLTRHGLGSQDIFLAIALQPGADHAAARKAMEDATAYQPLVSVMDLGEYTDTITAQVNQTMNLLYALLALSIVIAVLGIVNTLGLSMVERTREIGLLRAIALDRRQVRRMITLESVVIALLGALVGVGLGAGFGVVLQRLMRDNEITDLAIPTGQLTAFVAAAVLVGIVAAIVPARRAARTDILRAIATE